MPEAMERALKEKAKKQGFSEKRSNAFVYGTMRKTGWKPSTQQGKKFEGWHVTSKSRKKAIERRLKRGN